MTDNSFYFYHCIYHDFILWPLNDLATCIQRLNPDLLKSVCLFICFIIQNFCRVDFTVELYESEGGDLVRQRRSTFVSKQFDSHDSFSFFSLLYYHYDIEVGLSWTIFFSSHLFFFILFLFSFASFCVR